MSEPKPVMQDEHVCTPHFGIVTDFRFELARGIVLHSALVSGKEDGEDSTGRQKLSLMPAKDVAHRALDIAGEIVDEGIRRGWIQDSTVTHEERHIFTGRMTAMQDAGRFESKPEAQALSAMMDKFKAETEA